MKPLIVTAACCASILSLNKASAVTYSDSTFNLANYQIQTFVAGGPVVNVSQTQTGGNPGQALVVDTNVASAVRMKSLYVPALT